MSKPNTRPDFSTINPFIITRDADGLFRFLAEVFGGVEATLERAAARGAEIVTRPTPFFGDVFSRFLDPWGNLWWVYSTSGAQEQEDYGDTDWSEAGEGASWEPTPELTYIHDTLLEVLPRLRE